ncbi:MAG: hypothetical protein KTR16_17050 [Acidiferrobacterales bacterium]|nr:hypothetical protein [Acidiferrobacterales bacterium]
MATGNVRKILEAIGFLSIVGSLLFVGFEMHQNQQISSAEQDLSRAEINMEFRDSINENIEIWMAGNAGQPLDEASQIIYKALIMNAWDKSEALSQARSRLGSDVNLAIHQFAEFLHENPGARTIWTNEIERQMTNRQVLDYNVPGFELRRNLVFEDLAKLSQLSEDKRINEIPGNVSTAVSNRHEVKSSNTIYQSE